MRLVYIVDPRSLAVPRVRIPRLLADLLIKYVLDPYGLDTQTLEGHRKDVEWNREWLHD